MNDNVKIAVIAAIALVAGIYIYTYFTPYQTCVRAQLNAGVNEYIANSICAGKLGRQ